MKAASIESFIGSLNDVVVKADRQVGRNGFRTLHSNYVRDYVGEADFRSGLFDRVNAARIRIGIPAYTPAEYDRAWQYRNPGAERWSDARLEIVNLIIGWF